MLSSMLPLLKTVFPKKALQSLCQFRLDAIEANIKSYKQIIDDVKRPDAERVDAVEFLSELVHKRDVYHHELGVDHTAITT